MLGFAGRVTHGGDVQGRNSQLEGSAVHSLCPVKQIYMKWYGLCYWRG